jgi:hypothetical protein
MFSIAQSSIDCFAYARTIARLQRLQLSLRCPARFLFGASFDFPPLIDFDSQTSIERSLLLFSLSMRAFKSSQALSIRIVKRFLAISEAGLVINLNRSDSGLRGFLD